MPRNSPRRLPATTTTRAQNRRLIPGTWPLGSVPTQGRGQQQTAADIGGGDPEKGQLQVPGAQDIAGKNLVEVNAVRSSPVRPGSGPRRRPPATWAKKSRVTITKNLMVARWLGRGLARAAGAGLAVGRPLPAQIVEFAEGKENGGRPGQKGDQAQGAPEIGLGGRGVAHQRVIGKIVGVGIRLAGTTGHGGPGRPGKKGRQVAAARPGPGYTWPSDRRLRPGGQSSRSTGPPVLKGQFLGRS